LNLEPKNHGRHSLVFLKNGKRRGGFLVFLRNGRKKRRAEGVEGVKEKRKMTKGRWRKGFLATAKKK
jgi:hypothetical protein